LESQAEIPTTDPDVLLMRRLYNACEEVVDKESGFIHRRELLKALQTLGIVWIMSNRND
jgi:hypothetical protein